MSIRFLSILVSAMLVLSLVSTALAATNAVVNNPNPDERLNLRTKPSADAPSLGKYYNGLDVTLLGPEENGWYKVRFGTLTGYMQAKFLETDPDKMWMVQPVTISFTVSNASGTGLNLRELQFTKSKSLGFYKNGEIGYLLGVGETWCHVLMGNNEVGFMLRESLSPVPVFDKGSGSSGNGGSSETVTAAQVNNPNPDDRLNLRTEPSADAPSLGKYYNGVDVTLLGSEQNGWYKVRFGTLTGYMQAKFLEADPNKGAHTAFPSFTVNNTSGTGLNLRELQSTKSKSLGFYVNGEAGWVLGVGETWCHVLIGNDEVGFMLRESLSPVPVFDKGSRK